MNQKTGEVFQKDLSKLILVVPIPFQKFCTTLIIPFSIYSISSCATITDPDLFPCCLHNIYSCMVNSSQSRKKSWSGKFDHFSQGKKLLVNIEDLQQVYYSVSLLLKQFIGIWFHVIEGFESLNPTLVSAFTLPYFLSLGVGFFLSLWYFRKRPFLRSVSEKVYF